MEPRLGLERRSGALHLDAQSALLQRVRHGLAQAREAIFDQVVGRTLTHGRHGRLLANRAGHDDERNIQTARLQQIKRTQRVEPWQGIIGEDEVERRVERGLVRRRVFHPLPHRRKAEPAQLVQRQLSVGRPILQDQDL